MLVVLISRRELYENMCMRAVNQSIGNTEFLGLFPSTNKVP